MSTTPPPTERLAAWLLARRVRPDLLLALPVLAVLLLDAGDAWARAGGGHSFGGGSHGGGSRSHGSSRGFSTRSHGGGGSGDGDVGLLLWLLFQHPMIGVPVLLIVAFAAYAQRGQQRSAPVVIHGTPSSRVPDLARLRRADPAFSVPVFMDFARLVVTRAHTARGKGTWDALEAWLSPAARASLETRRAEDVHDVVIGATQLARVTWQGDDVQLHVRVESNVSEGAQQLLLHEAWIFVRRGAARSPAPGTLRALACPSCASPLERLLDGRCASCGTGLTGHEATWKVASVHLLERRPVRSVELHVGGGVEVGTDLPTVFAPDLATSQRAFFTRHPEVQWATLRARFSEIFLAIQAAWGDMRWERARPFETDAIFQQHRHWIERYRREGLRNRCEDVVVTDIVLAKAERDETYESLTVRIYARMRDWTETRSGDVVGGSKDDPRVFSEYWTFLRSAGATAAPRADLATCPSCAGALDKVAESGACGYCDAIITGGDFDWVLADIQQDEAYRG